MGEETPRYILTAICPDTMGIVAAVGAFMAENGAFITESAHFGDPDTRQFFMRTVFQAGRPDMTPIEPLRAQFAALAKRFSMEWNIRDAAQKMPVVIAVSKSGHCLNDLLHRWRIGVLPIEVRAVVSNHEDLRSFVEWHGIPYHYLPVSPETKAAQEAAFLDVVEAADAGLVVLARYMQILSNDMCQRLARRAINIHHSFLPGFKGARPYHRAHARGVKIIGATAHYVTADLDEGPIIEQAVERVDHTSTPQDLIDIGRDIETVVLGRAVRWHAEHRILLNGRKTVVFK
jgi:formyltetrahydrofolate deformylase